jgi:hypothetical protein
MKGQSHRSCYEGQGFEESVGVQLEFPQQDHGSLTACPYDKGRIS